MIHVESPACVKLYSKVHGPFLQRDLIMEVVPYLPNIPFNTAIDVEEFNVMLQSMFLPSRDREEILKIVGSVTDSFVKTVNDDGISQSVTIKQGVASVGNKVVPNPVELIPYRTFQEVEQPASQFIFRMQSGRDGGLPMCRLIEADGGEWRIEAIKNVKEWFSDKTAWKIPIIA